MPENGTEINENHEIIPEELVRAGLQNDKGRNAELISWDIKDFTNKGDGYTSFVTSVTVKYKKEENESDESYVVKLNPKRPPNPTTDMVKVMFSREKVILTDIIGAMNKYLHGLNLEPLKTPRVFASTMEEGREAFLAENLRTQGFQMHDRRKGQDYHHAVLVMEELGRFHASSLLLKESIEPKTFEETYEHFEEPWFNVENIMFKIFLKMMASQAELSIKYLSPIPKYEKCVKWLRTHQDDLGLNYITGFIPRKPFEVLVHGDCHTNNMLFKYNSMNMPVDMRFVDLQCTRLASPASDIDYFVYSSLTGEIRSKYLQKLLYIYYQSFSKVLIFARKKVPFTFKELEDEFEKKKILGLVMGMMTMQFLLVDGDEIVDFGEMKDDNLGDFAEKQRKSFQRLSSEGPFKDRFLSLFDEMLDSHIFDEK